MGLTNPVHLAIIVLIVLMVFGARRLPELGRSVGLGMRELKGSLNGDEHKPAELPAVAAASPGARPDTTT